MIEAPEAPVAGKLEGVVRVKPLKILHKTGQLTLLLIGTRLVDLCVPS
jgi:hypothetical protein